MLHGVKGDLGWGLSQIGCKAEKENNIHCSLLHKSQRFERLDDGPKVLC